MKSTSQVIKCTLVLGLALAWAPFCRAQTQTQTGARTEVAKLDDPAQPSPPGSPGKPAATTTTTDTPKTAAKASDPAVSPEIMSELDAMKKRIAELESELEGRSAAPAPANKEAAPATSEAAPTPSDAASTAATVEVVSTSTSSSSSSSSSDAVAESSSADPQGAAPAADTQGAQGAASATPAKKPDPFSLYDYTWMNANSRNEDTPLATKYFSPEVRWDSNYMLQNHHPVDNGELPRR